ncbi:unnamed protein product [Rotaria sp. Silwood2]|nr:unnamed protein product [Rotaria sp. Silwood2]
MLRSIKDGMDNIIFPLCDLAKIQPKGKYPPFIKILEELNAGMNMDTIKRITDTQGISTPSNDIVILSAINNMNVHGS